MIASTEQVSSPDVRFYDNEENNWERDMAQHRMGIEFFLVDNETPNSNIQSITKTFPSKISKQRILNSDYIEHFARLGNEYATFLNAIITHGDDVKLILDKDYPSDGFEPYIPDLLAWSRPSGQPKYVIFDWDKTITAVEGMYFGTHEGRSINDIPIYHVALFVMGGEHRLHKVREAIHHLKTNNVGIFIITNNPNAAAHTKSSRHIYLQLINIIFGADVDADSVLYCAKDYGYKKWKSACAIEILRPYLNCQEQIRMHATEEPGTEKERGIKRAKTPEGSTELTAPKKATGKKTAKSVEKIGGKRTKTRRTRNTKRHRYKTKKH